MGYSNTYLSWLKVARALGIQAKSFQGTGNIFSGIVAREGQCRTVECSEWMCVCVG